MMDPADEIGGLAASAEQAAIGGGLPPRRSRMRSAWRGLRKAPLTAWFGLIVIVFYLLIAVFANWVAPFGQSEVVGNQYDPWGAPYIFGTDQLGRDMLSRLIYGARNTIGIAVLTTALSFLIGGMLGMAAAILGGWIDQLLSRLVDILMAIPQLIFALVLLSMFGSSIPNLIMIIAVLDSTRVFRLSRAVALNVAALDFVEAARLQGEKLGWIMTREVLPNIAPPLVAEFGLRFCFVFLTIAALSFLGLGIQPPAADWGSLVRENIGALADGGASVIAPALAIASLTIAVNLVIDNLPGRAARERGAR